MIGTSCSRQQEIKTGYGRRQGPEYLTSVNGTSVFSEMIRKRGHRVSSIKRLSPKIEQYDTLIWFPDDFRPPDQEVRNRLELWMAKGQGRVLIYVGRDYDAAPEYWNEVTRITPAEHKAWARRRLAKAQAAHDNDRMSTPAEEFAEWFTVIGTSPPRKLKQLKGRWSRSLTGSTFDLPAEGYFEIPDDQKYDVNDGYKWKTLLSSGGVPIVIRIENVNESNWWQVRDMSSDDWDPAFGWSDGKIYVVANGSFLLNLPLASGENRLLAGRLADLCVGQVGMVESGRNGINVIDSDNTEQTTEWDWMTKRPFDFIYPHFFLLAIALCFFLFPIFGRPRQLQGNANSDFGKHIEALGDLMEKTHHDEAMLQKIKNYQDHVRRDSGKSHVRD